jgi:hypothetical protein
MACKLTDLQHRPDPLITPHSPSLTLYLTTLDRSECERRQPQDHRGNLQNEHKVGCIRQSSLVICHTDL